MSHQFFAGVFGFQLQLQLRLCIHSFRRPTRLLSLSQELVHVILLQNERKAEVLDVEWQIRIVKQPEHIQLLGNLLHTPLQLTDTLLLLSIRLQDVLQNLLGNADTLRQVNLLQRLGQKELFSNLHLLL